jgi:hypothetical protein
MFSKPSQLVELIKGREVEEFESFDSFFMRHLKSSDHCEILMVRKICLSKIKNFLINHFNGSMKMKEGSEWILMQSIKEP